MAVMRVTPALNADGEYYPGEANRITTEITSRHTDGKIFLRLDSPGIDLNGRYAYLTVDEAKQLRIYLTAAIEELED